MKNAYLFIAILLSSLACSLNTREKNAKSKINTNSSLNNKRTIKEKRKLIDSIYVGLIYNPELEKLNCDKDIGEGELFENIDMSYSIIIKNKKKIILIRKLVVSENGKYEGDFKVLKIVETMLDYEFSSSCNSDREIFVLGKNDIESCIIRIEKAYLFEKKSNKLIEISPLGLVCNYEGPCN